MSTSYQHKGDVRCRLRSLESFQAKEVSRITILDNLNFKTNLDRNSQRWRNVPAQQDPDDYGRECLRSCFPEAQLAR